MVHGIYAGDSRELSLRALFPSLWEMERQHGGVLKSLLRGGSSKTNREEQEAEEAEELKQVLPKEVVEASVWSLRGGLGAIPGAISQRLQEQKNVEVRLSTDIGEVSEDEGGLKVRNIALLFLDVR